MRCSHGARPLNMSSESLVRKRISPIQTKSGSAVSVHDDDEPQMVTAIASPAGREEKRQPPRHEQRERNAAHEERGRLGEAPEPRLHGWT